MKESRQAEVMEMFLSIKIAVTKDLDIPKLHYIPKPVPIKPEAKSVKKPANMFDLLSEEGEEEIYKSEYVEDLGGMFVKPRQGRKKR